MDERSISLILGSLSKLFPVAGQADAMFNARLLDTCPDVYRLFAADIEAEERSLVRTLKLVLCSVGPCGAILPTVRMLARFHKVCALVEAHYDAVSQTLVWTLRRSLGVGFTAEVERAWHHALHPPADVPAARSSRASIELRGVSAGGFRTHSIRRGTIAYG